MVRYARDLFGQADQDHDGELDVSEVSSITNPPIELGSASVFIMARHCVPQVAWLVEQLWIKLGEPIQIEGGESYMPETAS